MLIISILLVIAIIMLAVCFFYFTGMPDSRTSSGKSMKMLLLITGLSVLGALGVAIAIQVQQNTGVEIVGLSGGMESDAKQYINRNRNDPPAADQPGDNIRILREGLAFLHEHSGAGNSPRGQQIIQQYGGMPERPTRLLTRQEEIQYFEGAQAVYNLIEQIANPDGDGGETAD